MVKYRQTLADRAPTRAVPGLDLCPVTGRARLSYRRAAELFEHGTRPLASTGCRANGWTLHQLRHSALTHDAEAGTNTPMLLARSRHASMRSLERYALPGPEALARHAAATDPAQAPPALIQQPTARPTYRGHIRWFLGRYYGDPSGRTDTPLVDRAVIVDVSGVSWLGRQRMHAARFCPIRRRFRRAGRR